MPYLAPIVLLFCSNVFMTFAWYGQAEIPECGAVAGGAGQLGHRLFRILPGGARQPHRPSGLFRRPAQDPAGDHHLAVFGVFFGHVSGRKPKMESHGGIHVLCGAAFFSFHKWT